MKNFRLIMVAYLLSISPNLVSIPSIYDMPLLYAVLGNALPWANGFMEKNLEDNDKQDAARMEQFDKHSDKAKDLETKANYARRAAMYRHLRNSNVTTDPNYKYKITGSVCGAGTVAGFFCSPFAFFHFLSESSLELSNPQTFWGMKDKKDNIDLALVPTALHVVWSLPDFARLTYGHAKYAHAWMTTTQENVEGVLSSKVNEEILGSNRKNKQVGLGFNHANWQQLQSIISSPAANGGRTSTYNVVQPGFSEASTEEKPEIYLQNNKTNGTLPKAIIMDRKDTKVYEGVQLIPAQNVPWSISFASLHKDIYNPVKNAEKLAQVQADMQEGSEYLTKRANNSTVTELKKLEHKITRETLQAPDEYSEYLKILHDGNSTKDARNLAFNYWDKKCKCNDKIKFKNDQSTLFQQQNQHIGVLPKAFYGKHHPRASQSSIVEID